MIVEASDLLGVLTVVAYLAGMGAVSGRAFLLLRRDGTHMGLAVALGIVFLLYMMGVGIDAAPSVTTVLSNGVSDIPPTASARTGLFAAFIWLVHSVLLVLYRRVAR